MTKPFIVEGQIEQLDGKRLAGVTVRAFDKDLPSLKGRGLDEQQLGDDVIADGDGRYRITYSKDQFGRGEAHSRTKLRPDLLIRVFDDGTLLGESAVLYNAPDRANIDLAVSILERSAYEVLVSRISSVLQGVALADLTDDDLVFLTGETGVDPERHGVFHWSSGVIQRVFGSVPGTSRGSVDGLEILRTCAQLERQTGLPSAAFFAFERQGLALGIDTLVATPNETLHEALTSAITQHIAPASLRARVDEIVRHLKHHYDVQYSATGQLRDKSGGAAVSRPGFQVQVLRVNGTGTPLELGTSIADEQGRFSFVYLAPTAPRVAASKPLSLGFQLKISDPKGEGILDTEVSISIGTHDVFQVAISIPVEQSRPSPSISRVATQGNVAVPPKLTSFLDLRNIRTLSDVRRAGGLSTLADLPVSVDHPSVQALDAHADLDRISQDAAFNESLIQQGYTTVAAIADTPQSAFVSTMHKPIGDFKAARLHVMARAQSAIMDNALVGAAAANANGLEPDVTDSDGNSFFSERCLCNDCSSALSPAMYLADLLDYATNKHAIKDGASFVDIPFLSKLLRQPFGGLPLSCESVTQSVRRARICVEVLWAQINGGPALNPQQQLALDTAWRDYLVRAYTTLLTQVGTSYHEIRLARTATDGERKALADRLGIDLSLPRPKDELNRLFLDLTTDLGAATTVTALKNLERNIEEVFGLVDTNRDALSDGAKFGDDSGATLTRWQISGLEWGRNTDPDGYIYVGQSNPSVGLYNVKLFHDALRTKQVASSADQSSLGAVTLLPDSFSGLSATLEIASSAPNSSLFISAIPNLLSWRLRHLRTVWGQQDHPTDPYDQAALSRLPFIDPDVIGPDDFRSPLPKANAASPNRSFDLWLARRIVVDRALTKLQHDRVTNPDGLMVILESTFGSPLPNFDGILQNLTNGHNGAVASAKEAIANLDLTVESFIRLVALRTKDAHAAEGPGDPVSPDEWHEVYAILAQVEKVRLFTTWRAQEAQLQSPLTLGMQEFWPSLREPVEGDWPVARSDAVPMIDPDLVTLNDLPEAITSPQAAKFWKDRYAQLRQTIPQELAEERSTNGFDAMVFRALGTPPGTPLPPKDNLTALRTKLASSNPSVASAAHDAVIGDLHLTLDAFGRLIAIRDKDGMQDPVKKPTAAEYADVYSILTAARKVKTEYASWAAQEITAFSNEGGVAGVPVAYWRARKAALPRWRATAEARQAWRETLLARSSQPIVDPDLIDAYDLRDPFSGNAAFDLWDTRSTDLTARISTITTSPPASKNDLDQLLQHPDYLGSGAGIDALVGLQQDRSQGHSVTGRLDQLGLVSAGLDAIVATAQLLVSGNPVLPEDWAEFASILLQSYKHKQFATWRLQEADSVVLGPDLFQVRPMPTDLLSSVPPPALPAWRTTLDARRTWDDTLQSRIDEQSGVRSAMCSVVASTEEATLSYLRDGLVRATDAPGSPAELVRKAKWLTQKLLIDFQCGTCQTVTRTEQAMETVQSLFYALRTGLGGENLPVTLALAVDSSEFDKKWIWLNSYAKWRAAMQVFLYPETLLAPALRRKDRQTPAFGRLVRDLSASGQITRETTCEAALEYAAYYADVCTLFIEATCQTWTAAHPAGECRDIAYSAGSYVFYMFARGGATNKLYWCTCQPDSPDQDHAQGFWTEIELSGQLPSTSATGSLQSDLKDVTRLVGAEPYYAPSGKKYIHLFAEKRVANGKQLVTLRLDVDSQQWDGAVRELRPPSGLTFFDAFAVQMDDEAKPPRVALQAGNRVYLGQLNASGTDWAKEPDLLHGGFNPLCAAVRGNNKDALLFERVPASASEPGTFGVLAGWDAVQTSDGFRLADESPAVFHGVAWLPDGVNLEYVVFEELNGQLQVKFIHNGEVNGAGLPQINNIVPTAGWIPTQIPRQFVYEVRFVPGFGKFSRIRRLAATSSQIAPGFTAPPIFARCTFKRLNNDVELDTTAAVAPDVVIPLNIPSELSSVDLQDRREQIADAYTLNSSSPSSLLTYLDEAYYFVPMHLALLLQRSGEFEAALGWFRTVYDYSARNPADRKIFFGLRLEESFPETYKWTTDWLSDALNAHAVARTRRNAYTRYTLLTIVDCLLEYADSEFSQDTGESVARATALYETALELLDTDALTKSLTDCQSVISTLIVDDRLSTSAGAVLDRIRRYLHQIPDAARLRKTTTQVGDLLRRHQSTNQSLAEAQEVALRAVAESTSRESVGAAIAQSVKVRKMRSLSLLSSLGLEQSVAVAATAAAVDFRQAVSRATGIPDERLEDDLIDLPWLRVASPTLPLPPPDRGDAVVGVPHFKSEYVPSTIALSGCIPPNPVLNPLRSRADVNLRKIRTCRNIAGLQRQLEPYAAPMDGSRGLTTNSARGQMAFAAGAGIRPTVYRYSALIERAKQVAQLASQIEASMLQALEQRDAETYTLLKARQDLGLAQAGRQLQALRLTEANARVGLAQLQQDQAQTRAQHYEDLLKDSTSQGAQLEIQALANYESAIKWLRVLYTLNIDVGYHAATGNFATHFNLDPDFQDVNYATANGFNTGLGFSVALGVASSAVSQFTTVANAGALQASFERRTQEWQFQQQLAQGDVAIGQQQVLVANDDVQVVTKEGQIAALQVQNATDAIEFLTNKFTNVELYDWMSNVLERVYSFFLQQATAMAKLAENQLAFERQQVPQAYIQADYWTLPTDGGSATTTAGVAPDRRGLTGSARLLQDIYQLDQYAFQTNQRKLQLTKIVSMALTAPVEFQRFRDTGVLLFDTPMEMFDRDFPGHYLRLINRVRTSVIALIPPGQGISATLSTPAISRVVIGGGGSVFQSVPITRDPQLVALSSPNNATGLFDLQPQSDMLLPFEGSGVATTWAFSLPKPANLFDYGSIADVLMTIEYTALNSFEYRQQVIQTIRPTLSADKAYSFRNQFIDQWYDLHNPDQTATPMAVRFTTFPEDFPTNVSDPKIQQVLLYFSRSDGQAFEVPVESLKFTERGGAGAAGGGATSIDGVISTRRGNAGSWMAILGKAPFGDWELALPNRTDEVKNRFANDEIRDVMLVITYSGRTPAWPS